jgi:hypothetical protein
MKKFMAIFFMSLLLLLSGCGNTTIEEQKEKTDGAVKEVFTSSAEKTTDTAGDVSLYLPFGADIEKESPNNIIISKSSNTFILFTNPNEKEDSELLYTMTVKDKNNIVAEGTFQKENRFGYYVIKQLKDNKEYELIVGVGGTKMTTQSTMEDLAENSEMMMKIIRSINTED